MMKRTLAVLSLGCGLTQGAVVFSENFSSTTLSGKVNPYLGGWYTPQVAFEEWCGPAEATITVGGALQVAPTFGTRSAGIFLSPQGMSGPGTYTLTFDLLSYSGDPNDHAIVSVWAGSGYDLSGSSANTLVLDTQTASLNALGAATAGQLATATFDSAGTHQLQFSYDGTSAITLFFGAQTGGWPFPTAVFDNIGVSSVNPVPEPASASLLLLAGWLLSRRSRKTPA